ncbi:ArfGap-domain-containing protein [Atractiella rhizophila]|nr:ArfGap-domain-containing protein [Atractiella rhizophila]
MKQPGNKTCMDCSSPMPQWASLSFGTFICLSCSGQHRGLGVHITFVRSITMDKWTEEQLKYMKMGGNAACREFFETSPDYSSTLPIPQKYTAQFATLYKSKLAATIANRPWDPSQVPPPSPSNGSRPSTPSTPTGIGSSSLRKPGGRLGSSLRGNSTPSPIGSRSASPNPTSNSDFGMGGSQKERNENYFASLGAANASRPDNLPPSQGGKYGGFGNTSYTPSNSVAEATSSRALPTLDDLRDDPAKAVSKGWGFLSSAFGQAAKVVNESVVQPGMRMAQDPELHKQGWDYLHSAGETLQKGGSYLGDGLRQGGKMIKRETGYDVGELGAGYVDRRPETHGYSTVDQGFDDSSREPSTRYSHQGNDDFFADQLSPTSQSARPVENANEWKEFGFDDPPAKEAPTPASASAKGKGMRLGAVKRGATVPTPSVGTAKKEEDKWEDW